MCLVGVAVRRYIDFLILLIPTPLVSALFAAASLLFIIFLMFFVLVNLWNAKCNKIPRSNVAEILRLFKCVYAKRSLRKRL